MNELGSNKRKHARVKLPYVIKYRTSEKDWDAANPIDMSESGICFLTAQSFAPETPMQLRVRNPILQEEHIYECKVLRSTQLIDRPMFYETVLVIENLTDEARGAYIKLLNEFIKRNSGNMQ